MFLLAAAVVHAASYTVTSNADSGAGTLRQAINDALASPDAANTITFDAALDGATVTLTTFSNDTSGTSKEFGASAFFISSPKNLLVDAATGAVHGVTLARDTNASHYPGPPVTAPAFRLFDVGIGSTLTLRGLSLRNGIAQGGGSVGGGGALGAGGAIFNQGTLVVERCTFAGNQAIGGDTIAGSGRLGGGGVGMAADDTGAGGGPHSGTYPAGIGGFGGGGGGGFSGGSAGGNGGFGGGGGGGTTFSGGTFGFAGGNGGFGAGGGGGGNGTSTPGPGGVGGFGAGTGIVSAGGAGAGLGGAIFNDAGSVTLTNVTFSANSAHSGNGTGGGGSGYGGAIFNYAGSVTADFITASGNSVATGSSTGGAAGSADGGAIYNLADLQCSFGGNTCTAGVATLTLSHAIAANSNGAANDVVSSSINAGSQTYTPTNVLTGAVALSALASGGGLDAVMIPSTGSAAIDAAGACTMAIDQRGVSRPQGPACDSGAVEFTRTPGTWTVLTNTEPAALNTFDCAPAGASNGTCQTLRGAINNSVSGDTIVFAAALDGATITLTMYTNCLNQSDTLGTTCLPRTSEWASAGYVTQFGPSAFYIPRNRTLTIDAGTNGFVHGVTLARDTDASHYPGSPATAPQFRLFDAGVDSTLTLRGLKLSNGVARGGGRAGSDGSDAGGALGAGGALFNQGSLLVERCTFAGNQAFGGDVTLSGFGFGGEGVGLWHGFSSAGQGGGPNGGATGGGSGGFGGGGGYNNTPGRGGSGGFGGGGGGGYGGGGTVYRGGDGGFGGGGGGGFSNASSGFGAGAGSGGNPGTAGPGGGLGGAIFNDTGSVTLTNVTFSGNSASGGLGFKGGSAYGGAIFNYAGTLSADFITASGNSVASGISTSTGVADGGADGGAIYSLGDSDAACAAGGNACVAGAATLTLRHSIAANSSGALSDVVSNAINGGSKTYTAGDVLTGTVALDALASDGGLRAVMIPSLGSAAIDAAGACIAADQRGIARPQPTGGACDIGAVEVRQATLTVSVAGSGTVDEALVPPTPISGYISSCSSSGGTCIASFDLEIPSPPNLTLTLYLAPGTNAYSTAMGCGGSLSNNTYTTNAITANCTVNMKFVADPTAAAQSVNVAYNTAKSIALTGTSGTGTKTYALIGGSGPSHGAISGFSAATGALTYTPNASYSGTDSFQFTVADGAVSSTAATVSITVAAAVLPIANAQSVSVAFNTAKPITLTGSDSNAGGPFTLAYTVVAPPTHGGLSGTPPNPTYTPTNGYAGADSFTFKVADANGTSTPATVSITVSSQTATSVTIATPCMKTFVESQPTAFTAMVTGAGSPGGSVAFKNGATTLCSGSVSGGNASCETGNLAGGAYSVVANYGGDMSHASSASAPLALNVLSLVDALFRNGYEADVLGCPVE